MLLEVQLEAAAGGRFEGLPGAVAEVVALQAATGRCKWVRVRAHATHPWAKEGVAARSTPGAGAGGGGEGVGAGGAMSSVCVRRPCVGCARAGL